MRHRSELNILPTNFILRERFKIIRHIGGGKTNNLYITKDLFKKNYWVIKELINTFISPKERKEAIQQFEFEANLLLKLDHPQLPKVEDYFEENEKHYFVMEYIEGDDLKAIVEESDTLIEEHKVIEWGMNLCQVLHYLHTQKPHPIIFRDLTPDNVMLTDNDEIKLIDFGISKIFDPRSKTIAIAKSINPHFSPLEQYSTRSTDVRSDIYALGATLYFIATKTLPVDAIDRSIGNLSLKPPKNFNKSMSDELNGIIMKAMSLHAEERYQSVEEMKAELDIIYKKLSPDKIAVDGTSYNINKLPVTGELEEKEASEVESVIKVPQKLKLSLTKRRTGVYLIIACFILAIIYFFITYFFPGNILPKNKFYYITCNFHKKEEAKTFIIFLNKKKFYKLKMVINTDVNAFIDKGYRLMSRIEGKDIEKKISNLKRFLDKKGIKYGIYQTGENSKVLIISEEFKNEKQAIDSLARRNLKEFNVESYGIYLGGEKVYSVKIFIEN
ncbi:MAG TPA: serine/threonine-protein kinase, partial [Candidatus Eremiobacteraeota bacterium]|nr:serine/threonine-protein kinase [Candidatus Eremiobacteraeota bacterium]